MRLIDADKCPCIQCEDTRNAHCTYEHRSCKKFCDWLNTTVYDVEKVVEQLEHNAKEHDRIMCGCANIEERYCHSKIADTYMQSALIVKGEVQ